MSKGLLCLVLVPTLAAQISSLSPIDNGSQLYFTSALRQRGSEQSGLTKAYVIEVGGLRLVADLIPTGPPEYWTTNFEISGVESSGDGSVVAITQSRQCMGGSHCLFFDFNQVRVNYKGVESVYPNAGHLSANGRFLVLSADGLGGSAVLDLSTGERRKLGYASPKSAGRVVSADGSVLLDRPDGLHLSHPRWDQPLPLRRWKSFDGAAGINLAATTMVYDFQTGGPGAAVLDLASGVEYPLAGGRAAYAPRLNNPGTRVLFLSRADLTGENRGGVAQAFVSNSDGSELRQLTHEPAGIVEAALTGDGTEAYVVTGTGALLGVNARSGVVSQFLGPAPLVQRVTGAPVPGSPNRVFGAHLTSTSLIGPEPWPEELDGVRVLVNGQPARIHIISPAEIRYQIPWTVPTNPDGQGEIVLQVGEPQWEAVLSTHVDSFLPQAVDLELRLPDGSAPQVLHHDFRHPVTALDPALPGEVVLFYVTGLGPVTPPVQSGVASQGPFSVPALPLEWDFNDAGGTRPMEVPYMALAQALTGYFLTAVKIPADACGDLAALYCKRVGDDSGILVLSLWIRGARGPCPALGPPLVAPALAGEGVGVTTVHQSN